MSHFATLKDYQFKDRTDDIRGATLYGVDGDKLGTIDDVIFEHGSGGVKYCVVDTGGWLSSHKFLVPAERIHAFDRDPNALQVDLLKEHIEKYFPPYDGKTVERDEDWRDYEGRYQRSTTESRVWNDGPVMHREGSNRILTPDNVEGAGSGADMEGVDATPHRIAGKFPSTMPGGGKDHMVPSASPAVERGASFGNDAFVPVEQTFESTSQIGRLGRKESDVPVRDMDDADRDLHHRHVEGKIEDISSSPEFRPVDDTPPLGSMGEEIEPIAEPNAGRPKAPIVEVGAQRPLWTRDSMNDMRMNDARRDDVRDMQEDNMRSRPDRWRRFEDLLRKNRVDIEAKCAQCAPARDRKVG